MGGLISGIGSAVGGKKASKAAGEQADAMRYAADQAANTAKLGYNYLTSGAGAPAINQYVNNAGAAGNELMGLLGLGGNQQAANNALGNFLNSSNYKFQLNQGLNAASGNAATRGMLDSGATLKALNDYGQNMAHGALQGYMGNLYNLGTQGLDALKTVGAAGSQAGQAGASALMNGANSAANLTMQGVGAQNAGMGNLFNSIGAAVNMPQTTTAPLQSWGNFFGNLF